MKPLRPFLFSTQELGRSAFETVTGGREFLHLLRGVGATFSTVLLAYAARAGVKAVVSEVSRMLAGIGLNVFQG
ncbi:MAG TPA: hypothetical protein PKO06_16630, partial [Candidatus Ozemobacteraceae bacterium]|nr:hypothetical protein [Candidatus Ozemobacteraceae bacterium]